MKTFFIYEISFFDDARVFFLMLAKQPGKAVKYGLASLNVGRAFLPADRLSSRSRRLERRLRPRLARPPRCMLPFLSIAALFAANLFAANEKSFVGNQACARCHAGIYRRYSATPMALSSGRDPRPLTAGSFRHPASQVRYDIGANGLVTLSKGVARDTRQLSYYIGSGVAGRSFGYLRDGFLFEAPVTWYSQTGSWDVSPGYESDVASHWSRPIDPSCLFCHASQTRRREGTVNAYADPVFEQGGIACERCHGPGSLHIQGKAEMVNPSSLAPPLRDAVCAQCHLTGQSRVARTGRKIEDYRPGDALSEFVAFFVPANPEGFQVNSHFEKLAESTCKRAAGDRLWCGSCHDPHTVPAASERAAWFRAKCLTCHEATVCVRKRSPRVTAIDWSIGLNGVDQDTGLGSEAPSLVADDACAEGAVVSEGVTDREHPLANL